MKASQKGRLRLALAATVAATVMTTGCSAVGTGDDADGNDVLTIANSGELVSFDTAQAADGLLIQYYQPVFDSLLRRAPDGTVEANLATDWTYSEDFTELTLTLRDDVTFTDGSAFTAEVAVANIQHQIDANGVNASAVATIEGLSAPNDTTLVIDLTTPDPGLVDALAVTVGLMASADSLSADDFETNPIGSGPYLLDSDDTVAGDTYTYTANPDYWNPDAVKFDEIVIKTITDATARLNAVKSGQVQGTPLDLTQFDDAESSGLVVQASRDDWLGLMIFDRDGSIVPAFADDRVRQAISYAIDRQAIVAAFRAGHGEPTTQVFNEDSAAFVAELDDEFPYDVDTAKALLAEAGYGDGFAITLPDFGEIYGSEIFAVVTEQLAAIGITVELETLPIPDLVQRTLTGQYAIGLTGGGLGTDWNTINSYFLENSLFNPFHSTDAQLDGYIDAIRTSQGDEQAASYQELNRFIVTEGWATPFFRGDQVYASTDDVEIELQFGNIVPYISNFSPAA